MSGMNTKYPLKMPITLVLHVHNAKQQSGWLGGEQKNTNVSYDYK